MGLKKRQYNCKDKNGYLVAFLPMLNASVVVGCLVQYWRKANGWPKWCGVH
jgi:hypothetical protein